MSSSPTLSSRLRVLVAKTYRAERLYGSIRSPQQSSHHSAAAISQTANDIRAREWQRSHNELRLALNSIVTQGGNSSSIAKQIQSLRDQFRHQADQSLQAVHAGVGNLKDSSRRQEFAAVFKHAAELIRHKARAHANRSIADELKALLETSGHELSEDKNNTLPFGRFSARTKKAELQAKAQGNNRGNVVPLSRRSGAQ